jgi:hypothetical protein
MSAGPDARLESRAVRLVIRRAAPRLARDALGPLACFFVGWKSLGLVAGIAMATVFAVAVFVHERRQGRPAVVVRVALVVVAIRASVGIGSGSATAYLGLEIVIDLALASTVLGSLATARPFAAWFVDDVYPLPGEVRRAEPFERAMRTITAVWGVYFLIRAAVRLAALLMLSLDQYVLVSALSDVPFLVAILTWSVVYAVNVARRGEHWERLLADAEALLTP